MATIAFLLAAFLDPVQAALVLAIILFYRGPQPVLVAAAVAAAASETIITLASVGYIWGELIVPRLAASLMQAVLLWWAVRLVRLTVRGGDAEPAADGLSGNAATSADVESLAASPARGRRSAPWHVGAYAKWRLKRLH